MISDNKRGNVAPRLQIIPFPCGRPLIVYSFMKAVNNIESISNNEITTNIVCSHFIRRWWASSFCFEAFFGFNDLLAILTFLFIL
jgi:hypothetical protein